MGTFDIKYMPRTPIKGQILADLVIEFAEGPAENESKEHRMGEKSVGLVTAQEPLSWKVYVDGAANQKGSSMGLVLISLEKLIVEKSLRLDFSAMNNEAKYEALLEGMSMVQRMGGKSATMFSDSRLVVSQVKSELEARDERMQGYLTRIRHLQLKFESFNLQNILRSGNLFNSKFTSCYSHKRSGQDLKRKRESNLHSPRQNRAQLNGSHYSIPE